VRAPPDENSVTAAGLPGDHNRGPEADPAIEVEDVGIVHPDTTIRDGTADRSSGVGPMDGVFALARDRQGTPGSL
jgi:hypothetical protein